MDTRQARGRFLVELIRRYAGHDASVFELGCRAGDNLAFLHEAGFSDLSGVESSTEKVNRFLSSHPEVSRAADVRCGPVEAMIGTVGDREFDLVFTVGFFFDKEGDFGWIFPEIARITGRTLISIEDEREGSGLDFRDLYEKQGLIQQEEIDVGAVEEIESVFYGRVFKRS